MDQLIKDRYNDTILQEAMRRYGFAKDQIHSLDAFESFIYEFKRGSQAYILRIAHSFRRSESLVLGEQALIGSFRSHKTIQLEDDFRESLSQDVWKLVLINGEGELSNGTSWHATALNVRDGLTISYFPDPDFANESSNMWQSPTAERYNNITVISELPNAESGWASGFSENCGARAPSYTLSTGVTSGHSGPSFVQDIDGRVDISVVDGSADGTLPRADRQRQLIQNIPAMVTSLAGREEAIHLVDVRAIPCTLVFEHPSKRSPSRRSDCFGKPAVLEHATHVQVFHANQSIVTYQFCAQLLQEIHALISYFLVLASKQDAGLLPSGGAFYSARVLTMQPF